MHSLSDSDFKLSIFSFELGIYAKWECDEGRDAKKRGNEKAGEKERTPEIKNKAAEGKNELSAELI